MLPILLVEDDPLAQDIAASILQSQGMDVDIANDGFIALRMLRENSYSAALVDYHLPEMDGLALARLMRDISKAHGTSLNLVGVTADRHGLAARQGANGLFDAIVAKPYDPTELLRLLKPTCEPVLKGEKTEEQFHADQGLAGARLAAASFWRARGVQRFPRATVLPAPTLQQKAAIEMCFDIVDDDSAELLLVLDARGLQQLIRSRIERRVMDLPIVALDRSLAACSDLYFSVADRDSWSAVAMLLRERRTA